MMKIESFYKSLFKKNGPYNDKCFAEYTAILKCFKASHNKPHEASNTILDTWDACRKNKITTKYK